jgi:small GTP-binding protein
VILSFLLNIINTKSYVAKRSKMEEKDEYERMIKIIVIGASGVGKTNLLTRFVDNKFDIETQATIGIEFKTKNMVLNGERLKIQIWDTAGQERYQAICDAYFRGAKGAIMVYDITKEETFLSIEKTWHKRLIEGADENIVKMICGNKRDLENERAVTEEQGREFAEENNILFLETSALENHNVEEAFMEVVKAICARGGGSNDSDSDGLNSSDVSMDESDNSDSLSVGDKR